MLSPIINSINLAISIAAQQVLEKKYRCGWLVVYVLGGKNMVSFMPHKKPNVPVIQEEGYAFTFRVMPDIPLKKPLEEANIVYLYADDRMEEKLARISLVSETVLSQAKYQATGLAMKKMKEKKGGGEA